MTIKEGDLVMVVKPSTCCMRPVALGAVFRVDKTSTEPCHCGACGAELGSLRIAFGNGGGTVFPVNMLKKIDPPDEGDSLPTRKDLEMPA